MNLATQERPTYLAPVCVVCTQPITNPNYEIVCTSCQITAYRRTEDNGLQEVDSFNTSEYSYEVMRLIQEVLTVAEIKECCDSDGYHITHFKEEFVKRANDKLPVYYSHGNAVSGVAMRFIEIAARANAWISCSH